MKKAGHNSSAFCIFFSISTIKWNKCYTLSFKKYRYIDSVYERDNRQRTVIEALYNKLVQDFNNNIMDVLNEVLRYTKTNISPLEMISIADKAIKVKDTDLDQVEFPFEEARNGEIINNEKGWGIQWNKEYNKYKLNKFIFVILIIINNSLDKIKS